MGGLVVPCMCQVFCRNLFYKKFLPCLIVSVLRPWPGQYFLSEDGQYFLSEGGKRWGHKRGDLKETWKSLIFSEAFFRCFQAFFRSEKLQNESFPNFSIFRPEFCPEFCSEFSPNFLRSFRASFCGRWRPEKIHQKSPPFFNAKSPGKFEEKIHKMFLESGQSNIFWRCGNHPHPHKMRKLRPKLRPRRIWTARVQKHCKSVEKRKLRPWSEFPPQQNPDHGPG